MTKTLDLGCGAIPRNPFNAEELFGIDVMENLAGNIKSADLVVEKIPFEDESFDYLTAFDFIEHVPRLVYAPNRRNAFVELMNEVHRVLKPGGIFLSHTPAYPHAVAFRDPTHVNIITDETFPYYFDDKVRWASVYGFKGAFSVRSQEWRGPHLYVALKKVALETAPSSPNIGPVKVTVIVPVYNGAKHISRTLESLLAQTWDDFEILCVDDCSNDNSIDILNEWAARDARLKVFKTPANMGSAPKVINFVLPFMSGSHFVYSSQDDLFSTDWLEKMASRARETGADAVLPDVVLFHEAKPQLDISLIGIEGDRSVVLSGAEAVIKSLDWSIPANALWRAELIRKVGFDEFAINSDEYSARRFFNVCNKVVFSGGQFFYRQDNEEAVTKKKTCRSFDYPYTHVRIAHWLHEQGYPQPLVRKEMEKAERLMASLLRWFSDQKTNFSKEDLLLAESNIKKYNDIVAAGHALGNLIVPTKMERRKARRKNSLRKLKNRFLKLIPLAKT